MSSYSLLLRYLSILALISIIGAPPPRHNKVQKEPEIHDEPREAEFSHFHPYLSKVIDLINQDVHGKEWLSKLDEASIMLGNFTHDFKLNSTYILDQLHKLKEEETHRLEQIRRKGGEIPHDLDHHLDSNRKTFEKSDITLLLQKALMDIDTKRKEAFKRYEIVKERERRQKMGNMSVEEKRKFEAEEVVKKQHIPMHHPGSKQQLEDVWEDSDHLEKEDFEPKTFFTLHDLNGDNFWDEEEMEALFEKELKKKFPENDPNVDEVEKDEQRERMREHLLNEMDTDKDFRVSREEFMAKVASPDFTDDAEVDDLDGEQFTEDEYNDVGKQMDWDHPDNIQTMDLNQLHNVSNSLNQKDNIDNHVDNNLAINSQGDNPVSHDSINVPHSPAAPVSH